MEIPTQLQLAKDFIELSILINPDKQFLLSDYNIDNKHQILLHEAISELKKDGKINIDSSQECGIIITLKKNTP